MRPTVEGQGLHQQQEVLSGELNGLYRGRMGEAQEKHSGAWTTYFLDGGEGWNLIS